jgi:hypothetical protein
MTVALPRMTAHAQRRAHDRSIPDIARYLLMDYGVCKRAGDGTVSYYFDKRAWKDVEKLFGSWPLKKMEQLKRVYMVVSDDGAVVTIAYRD